jgi:hypothetical protein
MTAPTPTEVILVARGEPADQSPEQLRRIRDAVTEANVLLVAPALPVPGERWFAALADRASVIEAEIGDADLRAAVADARRLLPSAQIVDAPAAERERTAEPGHLMRLADRYGLMPASPAVGW